MHKWEDLRAAELLRKQAKEQEENISNKVTRIEKRLGKLSKTSQNVQNSLCKMGVLQKKSSADESFDSGSKLKPVSEAAERPNTKQLESDLASIKTTLARLESLMNQSIKQASASRSETWSGGFQVQSKAVVESSQKSEFKSVGVNFGFIPNNND